ncbi:methylase involved in ubiquinone/menaquinone biosynthesis [Tolypothrix sp. NIES-4075]|uniref:class I SAM-dependent methyltransferase n=1 Tax=Tolypothrix sp. NIES-4075 TaxID=2005459 RepID=UPI000B5CCC8D|nr:class I SAM-dependent methyltransferase [Tolypothrix sp. NIES-4075]GAX40941.1 methylase involved in ubiquinone/menaquinone biosynthesis [Tolypothrix sp. NIES-4075]
MVVLEEDPKLQSVVEKLIWQRQPFKVLEIGCGSCSHIEIPANSYIVGLDISQKQLDRNEILNEKILADVETYDLPESEFDLIVCWWILEHLSEPQKVLANCRKALKKDGIMIVAIPNVMSLKGLVTKFTPHAFHVWFYRYIFGEKLAGVDDRLPFKTYLRFSISPEAIRQFAAENDLLIERLHVYENPRQKKLRSRHWLIDKGWKMMSPVVKALTFGKVDAELTDFIVVMQKKV